MLDEAIARDEDPTTLLPHTSGAQTRRDPNLEGVRVGLVVGRHVERASLDAQVVVEHGLVNDSELERWEKQHPSVARVATVEAEAMLFLAGCLRDLGGVHSKRLPELMSHSRQCSGTCASHCAMKD
jgi:hypothetical protein